MSVGPGKGKTAKSRLYYAHTGKLPGKVDWELLVDHLAQTARHSSEFADAFGAAEWGYIAGQLHDLGKFSKEFQTYLEEQAKAPEQGSRGRVDHSSAGAQYAVSTLPILGHLLAYAIAGHHSGLLDGRSENACQERRLQNEVPEWKHGLTEIDIRFTPEIPDLVRSALGRKDPFSISFMVRMLYSGLVDADFLATEKHMSPARSLNRRACASLKEIAPGFFHALDEMEAGAKGSANRISILRHKVRGDCERAAGLAPGFFSLTVPTGGGKTLSSLAFALKHATIPDHNLRRIIYVVPFTTIIEQNADVFRRYVGADRVLEHHCNLSPDKETDASRLAAENWDSTLIVTTAVQFLESLFANKSSATRKLHRIARSVIVLDEAQTLPVQYLAPCLRALRELVDSYGCSVVLCTATQPEIKRQPGFEIGLDGVREIIQEPRKLYDQLKRVRVVAKGKMLDSELCEQILSQKQVLCIVNTTRHARLLFELIGPGEGHFHLSARMCPEHRRLRLRQIRRALGAGKTCRVVSTQVVEAGVDIDFPVVYRAIAGLDSIAQAAGRCNRNNGLPHLGRVFVFDSEHEASNRYFSDTAGCAKQAMSLYPDPLELNAIEHYFRLYYWDNKAKWDAHHILDCFHLQNEKAFPFNFSFARAASRFNLIEQQDSCTVIIPWNRCGRDVCDSLIAGPPPSREILRRAQRFSVQVYRNQWNEHAGGSIQLIYDNLGILLNPRQYYSSDTGLNLESAEPGYYFA